MAHTYPNPAEKIGRAIKSALGALLVAAILGAVYSLFLQESLGGFFAKKHEPAAYAFRHVEIEVREMGAPSGMWGTIPVELAIGNGGPRDVVAVTVDANFRDAYDATVWRRDVTRNVRVPAGEERVVVWKFLIGRRIGSDVARANLVRSVKIRPLRAETTGPLAVD
jgi:hypothetical protein